MKKTPKTDKVSSRIRLEAHKISLTPTSGRSPDHKASHTEESNTEAENTEAENTADEEMPQEEKSKQKGLIQQFFVKNFLTLLLPPFFQFTQRF